MAQQESFYEMLLQQPLFQGLGYHDLTDIVSKIKMDFKKFSSGSIVRAENAPCRDLLFLLKGELSVSHASENRKVIFTETWTTPAVVGVANIFGITQHHNRTYTAQTDIQTLSIGKEFVTHNLLPYEVFQFNLLGMLSSRVQRTNRMLWETPSESTLHRFVQVCRNNYLRPFGPKQIHGKMTDLAVYVDATRLNLSKLLNRLQDEGLLEINRKHLDIVSFEKLIMYAQNHKD